MSMDYRHKDQVKSRLCFQPSFQCHIRYHFQSYSIIQFSSRNSRIHSIWTIIVLVTIIGACRLINMNPMKSKRKYSQPIVSRRSIVVGTILIMISDALSKCVCVLVLTVFFKGVNKGPSLSL